jgi:phosphoglycerate dehydrogenase-like enzyme/glyoxylase-like metal-dependent hydrolase (beta-lactamase superfamily II)
MRRTVLFGIIISTVFLGVVGSVFAGDELPKMKFNDVREIAPGVFFRYSSISATDKTVEFGGSNNIWIVFEDYVVVYDANFPKEAGDVIAAIRKTTDKPIRYVLDSHHHGDHAYGNAVFGEAGATILAQTNCAHLLRTKGPQEFLEAGRGPTGRKDIAASYLKPPSLVFDEKLVLDDGKQRAECLFFGHAHTAGDAFLYLPKYKILCTGDACANGAYNYTGHSDTASWIRVLDRAQQLDVKIVCPGHGPLTTREVLKKQQRYFIELRKQVQAGIKAGKTIDDIITSIDMPWHKEWTGIEARERVENIRHVYDELTGRMTPWDLVEDFGIYEGPSPTKKDRGWSKPQRIVVPDLMPARLAELKAIAPEVLFVPVRTAAEAAKEAVDADAVLGFCSADIVQAGTKLRWIQVGHAGVENDLVPDLIKSNIVLTNTQKMYGPTVADQAMGLLLVLTRGIVTGANRQEKLREGWKELRAGRKLTELHGKAMLVVGLGGVGTQISRRASAFGMKVMAIDPNDKIVRPSFVFSIAPPSRLMELLPTADAVVMACPLTAETRGMMGASQFQAMKPSAYFINVARGGIVNTADLVGALQKKQLAGAGMDVLDPEPLPPDHVLWKLPNVALSPHIGAQSAGAHDRQWRLYRENVRRFVAGEPLVCVVNKEKGF